MTSTGNVVHPSSTAASQSQLGGRLRRALADIHYGQRRLFVRNSPAGIVGKSR